MQIKSMPTVIFFASLFVFTMGLSSQEIIGFDSRFYLFVQEMLRSGIRFFPETYHHPYPDYSASSTILIYVFALFWGGLNKCVAVFPTAIMAALTVTFTYLIGSLRNKHWGYCAAMMMLLTYFFVKSARAISLDMYSVLATTICFYLIYSADKENKRDRARWIYFFFIVGFIFRGPIGLVIPAGVVSVYYAINRNFKALFVKGVMAFLLLCLCTAVLLSLAFYVGGDGFMHDVLRMQVLGRMNNPYLPIYFYWTSSLTNYALSYLFSLLIIGIAAYHVYIDGDFFDENTLFLWQLLGWMMVILIGMSVPDDKKVRYILPMVPAIALIATYPFAAPSQYYFVILRRLFRNLFFIFPSIFLLATIFFQYYLRLNFVNHMLFFLLMQIINAIIFYGIDVQTLREKVVITIAASCFIFAMITIIEPIQLQMDKAREFVLATESSRTQAKSALVFYRESPDGLPIKYLIYKTSSDDPVFIQDADSLMRLAQPVYVVTSESNYLELSENIRKHFRVVARDVMGHVRVVVLIQILK